MRGRIGQSKPKAKMSKNAILHSLMKLIMWIKEQWNQFLKVVKKNSKVQKIASKKSGKLQKKRGLNKAPNLLCAMVVTPTRKCILLVELKFRRTTILSSIPFIFFILFYNSFGSSNTPLEIFP